MHESLKQCCLDFPKLYNYRINNAYVGLDKG